jgi:hypothetical protein
VKSIFLAATAFGTVTCAGVSAAGSGCPEFRCFFVLLLCVHWLSVSFNTVCMLRLVGT